MSSIAAAILGFAGGMVGGLLGGGGGVLFVPALAIFMDETQVRAEATSLLAIIPTAAVGTWRQLRLGNVDVRASIVVGVASILGVQGGVIVAESLPEHALRRLFGAFLVVSAVQIAWRVRHSP